MKKVYLETPEAVIKALKEGKEVYDNDNYSYKLIDGIIVSKRGSEYHSIGDSIYCDGNPYILEQEPLKIEVGKWYETRGHQKARCYYKGIEFAFLTIDNDNTPLSVYLNGRMREDMKAKLDIIGPWKEDKEND